MRALTVVLVVAACARGGSPGTVSVASGPYRLTVHDTYELGEDPTIAIEIEEPSPQRAELVIERPDGTSVKQHTRLDVEVTRVRFGSALPQPSDQPTFTMVGPYKLELRAAGDVLVTHEIVIANARLDELLPAADVADYKTIGRFTRRRQSGKHHWKAYGALYEHMWRKGVSVDILVEEPGPNFDDVWKPYEDAGALSVIEGRNVIYRERAESVTASWISGNRIVTMRAPTLGDLERGFIDHFLRRYPSKL
jgi:hypothetical protein